MICKKKTLISSAFSPACPPTSPLRIPMQSSRGIRIPRLTSFRPDMPLLQVFSDDFLPLIFPEFLAPLMRPRISREDWREAHPVFHPAATVGCVIQDHRLEIIHRMRKFRFRSLPCLKFIPDSPEQFRLVFRQKTENAVCRGHFPLFLCLLCRRIIRVCIAGVDLDKVMNQEHQDGMKHIDFFIRILREKRRHDRHMPGMLGIPLFSGTVGKICLPDDFFLLIDFPDKIQLLLQAGFLITPFVHFFSLPISFYTVTHFTLKRIALTFPTLTFLTLTFLALTFLALIPFAMKMLRADIPHADPFASHAWCASSKLCLTVHPMVCHSFFSYTVISAAPYARVYTASIPEPYITSYHIFHT